MTAPASRLGVWLATGLGLGYAPIAPGTAGSLGSVVLFALVQAFLSGSAFIVVYFAVLACLLPVSWWSTGQALLHWKTTDPRPVVIDEIVGQWITYGSLLVVEWPDLSGGGWKYLVAGFILFRAFDVLKPFPIRRSERLPGATGVVVDDLLAGIYAAAVLFLLAWRGWLN